MKNLIIILFFFSFLSISNAKENSFFVGTKLSNGRFVNTIKSEYSNKTYREKSYFLGSNLFFGGTIKNISINSGFGYNLYHKKLFLAYIDDPSEQYYKFQNSHLLSIPINVDYNINVYKNKLFIVVGIGVEYNITIAQKYKSNIRDTTLKHKELNKDFKLHSAVITSRCGLLYNVNNRIDIYSFFDFGYMVTKYLPSKNSTYVPIGKRYNYLLSGSIGLNVKFGKNIKKKEKSESSEPTNRRKD